jgi:acetyl-CoA synthetase
MDHVAQAFTSIDKTRFKRLLKPKSIVVLGGAGARYAISESLKLGFKGEIWAVHPKHTQMQGVKCYPSIDQLPGVPDAAYVALNAQATIEVVEQLNTIGCAGAVLHASGFSEVGDKGIERQKLLVEKAGTMPLIGPNCYGVLNCLDKAVLWPDQHGCIALDADTTNGVAVITQSGNIGLNITMQKRGLPLAFMFTMGNQANVSVADVIDLLLDDARVNTIGIHIEGLNDINHFDAVCRRALTKNVAIVAIKNGRSQAAAKIAMSHTSSLTGSDLLYDALFERLGIARVDTLEAFIETLKLLSIAGPLNNNQIASMSCSGGEAGTMADLIEGYDLTFPAMQTLHQKAVRDTLNEFVNVENPLDYHTFIWGDEPRLTASFSAMMQGNYDATLLLLDWPSFTDADPEPWDVAMQALISASQQTGNLAILLASLAECLPQAAINRCIEQGVVPMIGLENCLIALNAAYKIGKKQQQKPLQPLLLDRYIEPVTNYNLDEYQAKHALAEFGLQIPESILAENVEQAISFANKVGYPVVVKALSADIVHKTERGAVKLNLLDELQVAQAIAEMQHLSGVFLVEKMLQNVVSELIVGINRDEQFGLSLVIGSGGVMVELLKDSISLLLPTEKQTVYNAIKGLRMSSLLTGFRGRPHADIDACVTAIMAIAQYAEQNRDTLQELDINPLMVAPEKQGAFAADAYIRVCG